ncbi:hypothetical protein ABIE65_000724 [Constrictibacter sp. MBR-5]
MTRADNRFVPAMAFAVATNSSSRITDIRI